MGEYPLEALQGDGGPARLGRVDSEGSDGDGEGPVDVLDSALGAADNGVRS